MEKVTAEELYAKLYDFVVPDWEGEVDFYRELMADSSLVKIMVRLRLPVELGVSLCNSPKMESILRVLIYPRKCWKWRGKRVSVCPISIGFWAI